MIFLIPDFDERYILVENEVLEVIHRYRQRAHGDSESGGILMGYRSEAHLHVVAATTPLPLDRRTITSFERADPGHQKEMTRMWRRSNFHIDYLGEWHTHPQRRPTPSSIDHLEWKKLYSAQKRVLFFLIVGTETDIWAGIAINNQIIKV